MNRVVFLDRCTLRIVLVALTMCSAGRVSAACTGDCDGNGSVTVNELVTGVGIGLGSTAPSVCVSADRNGDGGVSVDELVAAVTSALNGCPLGSPTATVTPTETSSPSPTPTVNRSPEANAVGVYRTYPGQTVAVRLPASDPDGDPLAYAIDALPDGAALDPATGVLSWVPREDQAGPYSLAFSATDPGGLTVSASLPLQVDLPDPCVDLQCDPATGCRATLKPLAENCCTSADPPRVEQAVAACPLGKVLYVGRNYPRGGFGRIGNCHRIRLREGIQTGPVVVLNFETRCLNPFGVVFDTRLETSDAVVFDEFHGPYNLDLHEDGYAELRGEPFAVDRTLPPTSLEGREANLTVNMVEQEGVEVSATVRVVLSFDSIPDLPGH